MACLVGVVHTIHTNSGTKKTDFCVENTIFQVKARLAVFEFSAQRREFRRIFDRFIFSSRRQLSFVSKIFCRIYRTQEEQQRWK